MQVIESSSTSACQQRINTVACDSAGRYLGLDTSLRTALNMVNRHQLTRSAAGSNARDSTWAEILRRQSMRSIEMDLPTFCGRSQKIMRLLRSGRVIDIRGRSAVGHGCKKLRCTRRGSDGLPIGSHISHGEQVLFSRWRRRIPSGRGVLPPCGLLPRHGSAALVASQQFPLRLMEHVMPCLASSRW